MEHSGSTENPQREDATLAAKPPSTDSARQAAPTEKPNGGSPGSRPGGRRWPGRRNQETPPPPWRVEGMPEDDQDHAGGRPNWSRFWLILLGLLILNWILGSLLVSVVRPTVSYTFFLGQVNANNVQTVTSTGDTIQGTFRHQIAYPPGTTGARQVDQFTTQRPTFANDNLFQRLQANGVTVNANAPSQGTPLWEELLLWFGPALLLGGLLAWYMRSGGAGALGGLGGMGMGKSKARRYDPSSAKRTTFADVAGIEDVKNEVMEIVDFLRDPGKYRRLGAQIPRGVLLSGQPGTGKTLLARAVAGEADVPFFSISASEFVEMIVGVGASRVRDLFSQAKQAAPSIIFIDELDAIGRARGGSSTGGYDEREQTLNQILTEMDGFTGTEGVVVLAATNRPEILDSALLRPGRFDRRVTVSAPDQRGRRQILAVHTRDVPLAPGVDLDALAAATPGMVGADLKNLVNEAALRAARRGEDQVTMADFSDSLEKIVLGTARGIVLPPEERERTAFHESGHALLGMLTPGADPVRKISIIPRGQALGVTYQAPHDRPVRLLRDLPARPDHRRAGRPRRRGDHLRRRHHRRRKRHGTRQQHRPPDGGPVGHVPGHRPRLGPALQPGPSRRRRRRPRHQRAGRHRNPPDHRGMLRAGTSHPARQPRPAGPAGTHPPGPGDPGRRRSVCRGRHQPRQPPGRDRPRRSTRYHHSLRQSARCRPGRRGPHRACLQPVRPVQTVGNNQPEATRPRCPEGKAMTRAAASEGTPSRRSSPRRAGRRWSR